MANDQDSLREADGPEGKIKIHTPTLVGNSETERKAEREQREYRERVRE